MCLALFSRARIMAGAAPTFQQLVDQVVQLGTQVQQLTQLLTSAQQELADLKAKKESGWSGIMDKKQMMPDKFQKREEWLEWSESYVDYMEEIHPAVAKQLERAKKFPDVIDPVYPTENDKKLAKSVFKTMKKLIKEPDGKALIRSFRGTHNI